MQIYGQNKARKKAKKEEISETIEDELGEKYNLYHSTFSGAMQHAYDYAKKKLGVTVDKREIDSKVATEERNHLRVKQTSIDSKVKVEIYRYKFTTKVVQNHSS